MAKTPYLHRRGNNLYFRITVPTDIRPTLGLREVTRTLRTQHYNEAVPLALMLGARVRTIFNKVRCMSTDNADEVIKALVEIAALDALDPERQREIQRTIKDSVEDGPYRGLTPVQAARQWIEKNKIKELLEAEREARTQDRLTHASKVQAQHQRIQDLSKALDVLAHSPETDTPTTKSTSTTTTIMLDDAVKEYVEHYSTTGKSEMLEKIKTIVGILFVGLVGNKPVDTLAKRDLIHFFDEAQKLPRNWKSSYEKGVALHTIIESNAGLPGLSESTLKTPYRAALGGFLSWSESRLNDQGFPSLQITKHDITYRGDKRSGDNGQRAFKPDELKRLFEGEAMRKFAGSTKDLHKFWLTHIGLFTGARINEICQLNPQSDIKEVNGVMCFCITTANEADEGVEKSTKNVGSIRNVPIHSTLIELGLMGYIHHLQKSGAKRMFPAWPVIKGNASVKAGDWFGIQLKRLKLRDDTPSEKLVGFHAFRHTFITHADHNDIKYAALTGHEDKHIPDGSRTYVGKKPEPKLKEIMEQFKFDLNFVKPVTPS